MGDTNKKKKTKSVSSRYATPNTSRSEKRITPSVTGKSGGNSSRSSDYVTPSRGGGAPSVTGKKKKGGPPPVGGSSHRARTFNLGSSTDQLQTMVNNSRFSTKKKPIDDQRKPIIVRKGPTASKSVKPNETSVDDWKTKQRQTKERESSPVPTLDEILQSSPRGKIHTIQEGNENVDIMESNPEKPLIGGYSVRQGLNGTQDKKTKKAKDVGVKKMQFTEKNLPELQHEMFLLQCILQQWCFARAQADAAFSIQKEHAEDLLYAAWKRVLERKLAIIKEDGEATKMIALEKLDGLLRMQAEMLAKVGPEATEFMSNYSDLAASQADTLNRMPVRDAYVDPTSLMRALQDSEIVLKQIVDDPQNDDLMENFNELSADIKELQSTVAETCHELEKSRELLLALNALEMQERSLRVECIERSEM